MPVQSMFNWLIFNIGRSLNYIDVLDAQRRYFDAQISVSNAYRDEYLAVINLYKVLGGGWSADTPNNSDYKILYPRNGM